MKLNDYIIEIILEILNDDRVSEKIYSIVNKSSTTKPIFRVSLRKKQASKRLTMNENNYVHAQNKSSNDDVPLGNTELSAEIEELKSDKLSLEEEICNQKLEINTLKEKNESYKIFDKPMSIYESYRFLPEELKNKNLNYISEKTVLTFTSTGVMYLERFWDYIKEEILGGRLEHVEKLKSIFDFFFEVKNEADQIYIRNECNIGDAFNSDKHIMMPGGKNLSIVSEVVFPGFSDCKGKMIRKSVVKVNND